MEFVRDSEVIGLLKQIGVVEDPRDDERTYLHMSAAAGVVRIHLATPEATAEPTPGARVVTLPVEKIPTAIEGVIHKLHLSEVILMPVSRWRHVFDAVAFALAENEDWQAVDAAATVELNSRDPLLCEPGDFHTLSALMGALLGNADDPRQGLMITTTAAPMLVEIVPDGAARMSFGNQVMADEVSEALPGLAAG